jgi:hypothetical protein
MYSAVCLLTYRHPAHAIVAQLRMRAGIVMRRALLIREGADIRLVEQFDTQLLNALPIDRFNVILKALTLTLPEDFTLKSVGCCYVHGSTASGSVCTVAQ